MIPLLLLLSVAGVEGARPQTSNASARQADVYAIYSSLMSNLSGFETANPTYAIASTTKPAMSRFGLGTGSYLCIAPPPAYDSRWAEVLADFNARVEKPTALVRDLSISKPYMFITEDEVAAFRAGRQFEGLPLRAPAARPTPPPLDPKFQGLTHIFFLSDVYFSNDRTLALTGIANWCGGLCAQSRWKIYESISSGVWLEVRPARDCVVSA